MGINELDYQEINEEIVLAENSYRTIHKLIKSGMWKMYCNRQFEIVKVEWSDELRRMIGYKDVTDFPDVLESWSDLLHPEDHDRILQEIDPVLRDVTGNKIFDQEYRLNTKNRGYRWFRATGDVSRREDGTPYCFFGVFLDITEQKEHAALERARDEALEQAKDALTAMNVLHETMGSGAWSNTFDKDGKSIAVEWSDAFRALLGFKDEHDFPNKIDAFLERIHPENFENMISRYKSAIRDTSGKIVYDVEFRAKTKNGEYRWFRSTGRMTHRSDSPYNTFYGMFRDIDDEKKTNAALVWRDTLADIMTKNLDSVYVVLNKKNRDSVYVSPSIEHIFGIKKEISQPLLAIQKLEMDISEDFSIEEIKNLPEGQSMIRDSWIMPMGCTEAKMFQKSVYHVVRGSEDLLVFEFADHTHEQEVRKNIEDALEIAKNANAAKSNFLSNMSHDIRTPMNAIVGLSELMEHELDHPEKLKEYLRKIQTSSNHLLGLINDVLDMSKIESGETLLQVEKFYLPEQIEKIETIIRPQAIERGQHFEIKVENIRHKYLEGDTLRIRQVFLNILSNAVKYTPEGGTILFTIKELACSSDSCARYGFSVKDNGIGMKKEYQKRIFEPFTRQENSVTNQVQGTGLGMAITKNIVDMMGGVIQVDSVEGKGSTFEVVLELRIDKEEKQKSADEMRKNRQSRQKPEEEKAALAGLHFLCAEDNEINGEILEALLKLVGADCEIYTNGKELVERFMQMNPDTCDVILMDVQMPLMNGYEATRAIRAGQNPWGKEVPIIAMTANAFADDIQQSMEAGMNAHISKPMDIDKLLETLGEVL